MGKYWSACSQSVSGATGAQHRPSLWLPLKRLHFWPNLRLSPSFSSTSRLRFLLDLSEWAPESPWSFLGGALPRYLADAQVGMWVHTRSCTPTFTHVIGLDLKALSVGLTSRREQPHEAARSHWAATLEANVAFFALPKSWCHWTVFCMKNPSLQGK